jgi:AcrR family transcriptional regulator
VPRHPNPELEQRILEAATRLWARGGTKALTMRGVAKAAGTTTPTVYERYRDRESILRALRLKTRGELFAALSRARSLSGMIESYLEFALENRHSYEILFDGVGRPPSLQEPWPSFNLMREQLCERLGGSPRDHNRLMLAIWSLMHGAAMLIIRGSFEGALRTQAVHACIDATENLLRTAKRTKSQVHSGPKWPPSLILGEGQKSQLGNGNGENGNPRVRRPQKNSART